MQRGDCTCAFLVLRTLARIEEITTSVPFETALQVTSTAERPSLAVLSCERCRQQRLPLTAVTILCAHVVNWLCRLWNLADDDEAETSTNASSTSTTTNSDTKNATEPPKTAPNATQRWEFSIGSYDLAADEADALSNELMTLRLTGFSAVLGSLEAALVSCSPNGRANGIVNETAHFAPACLQLVRTNLRLVRTCIRHLKERSLLNGSGTGTLFASN
ncbi:hypothetical protein yc1106_10085 [Curvularia clavata]|uniref:Uncharacterized protein n=1 Tax=Curvularia clavata TaxID=95742 RepID=A0A9Q8ZG74_CURCL|nr:hypothetical protein yc1106_10085 [Curvularia clavata]